jgi:hypothetical protein
MSPFRSLFFFAAFALFVANPPDTARAEVTIWISPRGDDHNPGTEAAPVASLPRAAELVRASRAAQPAEPVTVWLGAGDYPVLSTLVLGEAESGTAAAPVTWRGVDRERVRLVGARPVAKSSVRRVTDPALHKRTAPEARGRLVEIDLAAEGVRHAARFPDYVRDTADLCVLFHDGVRLPLSRWPNGPYGYATMQRVLKSGSFKPRQPDGGVFEYAGDRPARWRAALAEDGVWLRGFWRVPWVAETLRVGAIDPEARTISFAVSTSNGIGSKYSKLVDGTRVGDGKENWFALNLLEEIDQPGEWSVDFKRRKILLFPPGKLVPGALALADNDQPLLSFAAARFVTLRDVTLGRQMGDAVVITDGESVRLAGCRVEGVVRRGVVIRGGRNHVVQSCDLTEIGLAAIDLLGGDRATLAPSGHQIVNNHIWRSALLSPVPALIAGLEVRTQQLVGARIAHNRIHDVSYSGIHFAGNDNILENNELYRLGLDGGDLGGLYTTGGWTSRGNVVRANFIHHSENANAVYMDDGDSGLLVEDNVVYRTESGVFIGGGHDHLVRRNLIVACPRAFHVDDRGVARKYTADDPRLRGDLDSVPWRDSPWRERYPAMATLLDADPSVPRGNLLTGNVAVGCATFARRSGKAETLTGFAFSDNAELAELTALADPAALDFSARSPAAREAVAGWPSFDLARYGLQVDEFRPVVVPRDLALLKAGDTKRKAFDSQQDVNAYPR